MAPTEEVSEKLILESLKESDVLATFKKLLSALPKKNTIFERYL